MDKEYSTYTTAAFLEDPFFIEWVRDQTETVSVFWNEWLKTSPLNLNEMLAAKAQLQAIFSMQPINMQEEAAGEVWEKIRLHIDKTQEMKAGTDGRPAVIKEIKKWLSAAAVLITMLAAGYWTYLQYGNNAKTAAGHTHNNLAKTDIQPGGNKAVLTLADGNIIVLDSAQSGTLDREGNTRIIKLDNGSVSYENAGGKPDQVLYNTISTPRGGQYQVTLSDGTKVWLNALSSIRFPTVFTGKERPVEITGEAYFEVAHNPARPFKVVANDVETIALGTHFNVNAYSDENAVATTLLQGSVKVSKGAASTLLHPGQQSQVDPKGDIHLNNEVDMNLVIAWKNGFFQFREASLETIMKQVERWYNVDVVFEGARPSAIYTGKAPKNITLATFIKVLELSDVSLDVKGNRIIIKNNQE